MADFARLADDFERVGIALAGASVDPPALQRRLMRQARLPFPIFSDETRAACRALELLDDSELGGLARPATLFVSADGALRRLEREGRTERIDARAALEFMRGADPAAPLPRHPVRPPPAWRARGWLRYALRRLRAGKGAKMNPVAQATCPEGHPLFVCRLCELIFEGGLADPLPDGSVRCPQCLMGETDPFAGPVPDDAITHASRFT